MDRILKPYGKQEKRPEIGEKAFLPLPLIEDGPSWFNKIQQTKTRRQKILDLKPSDLPVLKPQKFFYKIEKVTKRPALKISYNCSIGYATGISATNTFFKPLFCGKEWCPYCGSYLSTTHIRRIIRLQPKIDQINMMSYLVITIPKNLRVYFTVQSVLEDFRDYWKRKIKREYPGTKGLTRYHWFGDTHINEYNPHLNILFESKGFIEKEEREKWRSELALWFKTKFELDYFPETNIYHQYTTDEGKKKHWLNYVTRATFFATDSQVVEKIKKVVLGFRNTATFGKFEKPDQQAESEVSAVIRKNIDLTDNSPIIWQKTEKKRIRKTVDMDTGEEIIETYYSPAIKLDKIDQFTKVIQQIPKLDDLGAGIFRIKTKDFFIIPDEKPKANQDRKSLENFENSD